MTTIESIMARSRVPSKHRPKKGSPPASGERRMTMPRRLTVLLILLVLVAGAAVLRWTMTPRPGPGRENYLAGMKAAEAGSLDTAIQSLRQAVLLEPGNGDYHAELGGVYLQAARYEAAATHLQMAAFLAPQRPHIYCQLAQSLVEERRRDEALLAFAEALRRTSDCPHALSVRGEQFLRDDNLKDALAAFEQVIRLEPGFGLAYQKAGYILLATNRVDEAIGKLLKSREINPHDPGTHALLGEAYARRAHDPEAARKAEYHYQIALPNNPDSGKIHAALGKLFLRRNDLEAAREQFQKAVVLQPYLNEAVYGLVQIARRQGKKAEASRLETRFKEGEQFTRRLGDLAARAQAEPKNLTVKLEMARLYLGAGLFKDAERTLDAAAALDPSHREARELRARLYLVSGQGEKAAREFAVAERLPYTP